MGDNDYQERRKELIEDAKSTKEEVDRKQSAMLDAVAEGDNAVHEKEYEWVKIGEVDAKVKAWLPGSSIDTITRAQKLAQRENIDDSMQSIETMIDGMVSVTEALEVDGFDTSETAEIREFWQGLFNRYGVAGFQTAAQTVLEPAAEDFEAKSGAVDGFRKDGPRPKPGVSSGTDGE